MRNVYPIFLIVGVMLSFLVVFICGCGSGGGGTESSGATVRVSVNWTTLPDATNVTFSLTQGGLLQGSTTLTKPATTGTIPHVPVGPGLLRAEAYNAANILVASGTTPITVTTGTVPAPSISYVPTLTAPPTVSILTPANNQQITAATSMIAISGTAAVDAPAIITAVNVRINGGAWQLASGTTSWLLSLPLSTGANTIDVQAFAATTGSNIATVAVTYANAPATGSVTGKITIAGTAVALSGVQVSCGGIVYTTGPDGLYTLSGVPAGVQTLLANLTGYESYQETVTITPSPALTRNISLTALSTRLYGAVRSAKGPLANAIVTLDGNMTDTTDANGNYEFPSAPQGNRTLTVRIPFTMSYKYYTETIFLTAAARRYDIKLDATLPGEGSGSPDGNDIMAGTNGPLPFESLGALVYVEQGGHVNYNNKSCFGTVIPGESLKMCADVIKSVSFKFDFVFSDWNNGSTSVFTTVTSDTFTMTGTQSFTVSIPFSVPFKAYRDIGARISSVRVTNIDDRSCDYEWYSFPSIGSYLWCFPWDKDSY